ncbi:MAG: tRNA (adenosine(37)-N6)-threonylcarbamoyltransferase complex transferase subunit TsaD [Candidatus Harrisonbacteria bacterium RIFCSPLOWO2_02_FULL_41_11]|uniref:tRNA N6-adenosine threonylcarbamoyltransferase n=1 Tax=Candidatus Harrisonbacteria bacterium RIFCSPHIGHO2_02_FULL_42_16 TaxID=1798404 RepID=A0A1G1ZHV4_9BACT|nr:MAG: tRNA (adenosine(37)-N6)-threonylcarbamoyltransferase complex transferase subunit TsaD [Candidatus Harrisonbacteria bacterium RIFCSPHIGHO2_02_FULL_42_16]OGY67170.1 MAG: tRNA (adenosine(37)-N6)-threonylcarbamoyltransferase complex transferase subunit TsaD [Candidatus Harrisonbacteria bacterium RIFCSPLOWO2_02_FULL_41_11]
MKILAIETSCDETSIALVKCGGGLKSPKFQVLKNIVSSQIAVHRPFGGVVPNLAKREHLKNLPKIFKTLNPKPSTSTSLRLSEPNGLNPDYIAATVGPGLEPALWTGINFTEELSKKLNKPLIGVNHMEGHLYSCFLPKKTAEISNSKFLISKKNTKTLYPKPSTLNPKIKFPAVALIVSGGHTILLNMKSITKWTKLGETLDDAAGEAFDKVARMLKLPYPGGPEIQKLAARGNPDAIKFPRPLLNPKNVKDVYNFSFSGLKTSVLYYLRDHSQENYSSLNPLRSSSDSLASPRRLAQHSGGRAKPAVEVSEKNNFLANVAASFQKAVIDVLTQKTLRAAKEFKAKSVLLCGGVSANRALRETLKLTTFDLKLNFVVPDYEYNTDNAAMIAAAAYINLLQKKKKGLQLVANGNLTL